MTTVSWTFARGGSKGVKGKNLRILAGRPLIVHAIEAAKAAKLVDRVMVSTDSSEIADVARKAGAEVPFMRPAELATDDAPEWLAWQHAVRWMRENGERMDTFVSVPTTAPLRLPEDIDRCIIELRLHSDAAAVITVTDAKRNPFFNQLMHNSYGELVRPTQGNIVWPIPQRRQDAPRVYDCTTVAYALRPDFILKADGIIGGHVHTIIVPPERALDIDTELDLRIAEFLLNERDNYHTRPHICLEPSVCFGQATCAPRLQCWAPAEYYWAGESMESVVSEWPGNSATGWPALRREDVLLACWYLATYDSRTWRKRWGAWAKENSDALWHSDWARVDDPPQRWMREANG